MNTLPKFGVVVLTPVEKLVLSRMVPDQPIRAKALQAIVGPSPRVAPALTELARKGYVRATSDPKRGRAFLWIRTRERLLVPDRPSRVRSRKAPIAVLLTDVEAIQTTLTRVETNLKRVADQLATLERLREVLS